MVRVDAGRSKVGFYGTLEVKTGAEIVTRSTTFSAEISAEHLQQVLDAFPERPILLFWDRAPWHRGEPIRRLLAANPRLEIIEYPVAAPELNPQEQVWKQTRRAVSHNHLTPKLPQLADNFENHLRSNTFDSSFLHRYGYYLVCPFLN
jgi:transposase